jgi:hypothetical protein
VTVEGNLVSTDAVRDLLPEPADARVEGGELVCYVTGERTPTGLPAASVAALPGRPAAMASHRHVVCDTPPADPADRPHQPVRDAGNGR